MSKNLLKVVGILSGVAVLAVISTCGCCLCTSACGSQIAGDAAAAEAGLIDTARQACAPPRVFRTRPGGSAIRASDWECVGPEVLVAEAEAARAAAAAEAARVAAIDAARSSCASPDVFRVRAGGSSSTASGWECVSAETVAAEDAIRQAAAEAAAERERVAAAAAQLERERAAEAARIAALPMEVVACQVQDAYQRNEIAADERYPEGRRMIVTGRVDRVSETFGTMVVHPRGCFLASIRLADDQRGVAGSLSRGDSFEADCTMGRFIMGATWDDCRILR